MTIKMKGAAPGCKPRGWQRQMVEAMGMSWEVFRARRRRGATIEQALAGDRRKLPRTPRCEHCGGKVPS